MQLLMEFCVILFKLLAHFSCGGGIGMVRLPTYLCDCMPLQNPATLGLAVS